MSDSRLGPPTPPRGEDLPFDDGEPMETERHREQMFVLIHSLQDAWKDRRDVYVTGNMALYFSETQSRRNDFRAPDFFVVLDTVRRERKSWVVWEEDGRTPDVVVEITSETTEAVDRGVKMNVYAKLLRVACYVIYDPFSSRLDAYRLNVEHRSYERIEPDADGRVWVEPLGLFLGVKRGVFKDIDAPWLRWLERDGRVLPYGPEIVEAAQEEARSAQEEARAMAQRARAAEAELAALRERLREK